MTKKNCPCGHPQSYAACCGRYIDGETPAPDANALMRSRYTAYVRHNSAYLLATWHASTRPEILDFDDETHPQPKWLELSVKRFEQQDADHATVEFIARHRIAGRGHRLHETSRFIRENGRWYYIDGDLAED